MTACRNCTEAKAQAWHGFSHDCDGCRARALARSPEYAESRGRGVLMPAYRQALASVGMKHEDVKAAWLADAMNRGGRDGR